MNSSSKVKVTAFTDFDGKEEVTSEIDISESDISESECKKIFIDKISVKGRTKEEELEIGRKMWISVEERLPDFWEVIIAYGIKEKGGELEVFPANFNLFLKQYEWEMLDEILPTGSGQIAFKVTHWMPLPHPPNE